MGPAFSLEKVEDTQDAKHRTRSFLLKKVAGTKYAKHETNAQDEKWKTKDTQKTKSLPTDKNKLL